MSEVLKKLWWKRPLWPFSNPPAEFVIGNVEIQNYSWAWDGTAIYPYWWRLVLSWAKGQVGRCSPGL